MRTETIRAVSAWDFVQKLNNSAMIPADNAYGYMRRYAEWTREIYDIKVAWHDPDRFVADLISNGHLTVTGTDYVLSSPPTDDEPLLLPIPDKFLDLHKLAY